MIKKSLTDFPKSNSGQHRPPLVDNNPGNTTITYTEACNWIALQTIVHKEITRFMRIWPQTLLPSAITQALYFLIFGKFIGAQIGDIKGLSYMAFIVPGLVMMAVINNSFSNVVSSFFSSKFQRNVEEWMISPTPHWVIILGYVVSGSLRGLLVGIIVFGISFLFTHPSIHSFGIIALFLILVAIVFSLGGFLNGLLAKKFDDIAIFQTFLLTPLIYLGGVFYSTENLPGLWQKASQFNPLLYMVNGFRYGFYGVSDVNVVVSVEILVVSAILLTGINLYLLKTGIGLRS